MLKVALFAPYLPAPAFTGGRIRIHQLMRSLSELGEVHLFAQAHGWELKQALASPELRAFTSYRTARRLLPAWPCSTLPMRVQRGSPRRLRRGFREAGRFDVAVVEHSHAARWASEAGIPWVLDEHNIESRYLEATLRAKNQVAPHEIRRLELWERELWRRAGEVVCVTTEDQQEIERYREAGCELVPNGVCNAAIPFRPPSLRTGQEVLFIGLMNHPPNESAAVRLAREIMPIVRQTLPEARLVLCGANPSPSVRALASSRTVVTGRVASIEPFLTRARAYAFPLAEGAGSSLKVLEALASGVPLVSSALGVRGYGLLEGVHYRRAEERDSFAQQLVDVLSGAALDAVAERGRAVSEAFDWSELGQRFSRIVERCASKVR